MTTNKGAANTAAPTAADHANTVRDALEYQEQHSLHGPLFPEALAALDALAAQAETAERLQHLIDCADTPLMRDVMTERDAAVQAAEFWKSKEDEAVGRLAAAEQAADQARNALREIDRAATRAIEKKSRLADVTEVAFIARAALAGNQP